MRINEVIENITYKVGKPTEFTPKELQKVSDLINSGGQLVINVTPAYVKKAKIIAVAFVKGQVIGISAIKGTDRSYKDYVFDSAGAEKVANQYSLEMGWKFVVPEFRGHQLGKTLSEKALAAIGANKIFVTIRASNQASLTPIRQLGFKPLGKPYIGPSGNKIILLVR
ncbi:MAG TPA: hypothetical protein VFM18_17510 [Methanosarcina sp.]|nr:hypothetical protein [Methanosarcina sp.]